MQNTKLLRMRVTSSQWNLSIAVTHGPKTFGLIREVPVVRIHW